MGTETHEGRGLGHAAETKLRVLQRSGVKMAVMLEKIFWSQLDDLAKANGTSTTKLVFELLRDFPEARNRTSLLRCHCLEMARTTASLNRLQAESFDMLGIIAACPSPVAVITAQRKIAAFNPSFSNLIAAMRSQQDAPGTAIQFSFGEAIPKIQNMLISQPTRLVTFQVGVQVGGSKARFYHCRFALADRGKGTQSLILIFFENEQRPALPVVQA